LGDGYRAGESAAGIDLLVNTSRDKIRERAGRVARVPAKRVAGQIVVGSDHESAGTNRGSCETENEKYDKSDKNFSLSRHLYLLRALLIGRSQPPRDSVVVTRPVPMRTGS